MTTPQVTASGLAGELAEETANAEAKQAMGPLIREYAEILWRFKAVIIASLIVSVVLAGLYTSRLRARYAATASIILKYESLSPLRGQIDEVSDSMNAVGSPWAGNEYRTTQLSIIRSPQVVLGEVVKNLRLDTDVDFLDIAGLSEAEQAAVLENIDPVEVLQSRVSVAVPRDTMIVEIRVEDTDARRAAVIANEIVNVYLEKSLDRQTRVTREAAAWLDEQVVSLQKQLKAREQQLHTFLRDNQVIATSFEAQQDLLSKKLELYQRKYDELIIEKNQQAALLKTIQSGANGDSVAMSKMFTGQGVLEEARSEYNKVQLEFAEAAAKYGPSHPAYKNAKERLDGARHILESESKVALERLGAQIHHVNELDNRIKAILTQTEHEAFASNRLAVEYKSIEYDLENLRNLYSLVLKRSKETELTGMLRFSNVERFERAKPPAGPFFPNRIINFAIAIVVGLGLGTLLALLLDQFDQSLRGAAEVEKILRAPCLGVVPLLGSVKVDNLANREVYEDVRSRSTRSTIDLFPFFFPKSPVAEVYRLVRTNLLFMSPDKPLRVMMVTSTNPKEGKSTVAYHIAITMASMGQRVLLIDTDLRRPAVHRSLAIDNTTGATNWITGESRLEDVVVQTPIPNLSVVSSGPLPPNPSELLSSKRFRDLVEETRGKFDRVIFDTPPAAVVSDPLIVSMLVDGVVYVVNPKVTHRDALRGVIRQLRDVDAPVMGFVFNGIDVSDVRYGPSYYRYYRRGYYTYSYYSEEAEPTK